MSVHIGPPKPPLLEDVDTQALLHSIQKARIEKSNKFKQNRHEAQNRTLLHKIHKSKERRNEETYDQIKMFETMERIAVHERKEYNELHKKFDKLVIEKLVSVDMTFDDYLLLKDDVGEDDMKRVFTANAPGTDESVLQRVWRINRSEKSKIVLDLLKCGVCEPGVEERETLSRFFFVIIGTPYWYVPHYVEELWVEIMNTRKKFDVNAVDTRPGHDHRTVLQSVIQTRFKFDKLVNKLLSSSVLDVNAIDRNGMTALIHACLREKIEVVRSLAARDDLDVNYMNTETGHGTSAFLECADVSHVRNSNVELISELFKIPRLDVNIANSRGTTALHRACSAFGTYDIIKKLLEHPDINVNATDNKGFTPLMTLCTSLHADNEPSRQLLIQFPKLNINSKSNAGMTVLMYCATFGIMESTEKILRNPEVRVDERDKTGQTALIHACIMRHDRVAKVLILDGGADVNAVDMTGRSALEIACENDLPETIVELSRSPRLHQPDWERLKHAVLSSRIHKLLWPLIEHTIRQGMEEARATAQPM
jgi:ankyrin repeat protein